MSRSFVWTLIVCLIGFVLVGVTHANPEWPLESGLDFWNVSQYQAELDAYRRINDNLDQLCVAVRHRNETKQHVLQEVVSERLTLAQAAIEIRELTASNPGFLTVSRRAYPGCSDDELYCRNVIASVRNLALPAAQCDRVVSGLNAQLEALKAKGYGTVVLSE